MHNNDMITQLGNPSTWGDEEIFNLAMLYCVTSESALPPSVALGLEYKSTSPQLKNGSKIMTIACYCPSSMEWFQTEEGMEAVRRLELLTEMGILIEESVRTED